MSPVMQIRFAGEEQAMTTRSLRRRVGVGTVALLTALAVLATPGPAVATEAEADYQPTFAKDVMPILQLKCQECHQPNSIAPMSLLTYPEVRPWARAIKDRVVSLEMAALAHRSYGRHPEVQERPVAEPGADRHHRAVGGWRRAAG